MAKKILVIDDEELIVKSFSKLLERNGYEVLVAKNGQDAIAMIEEQDFDLIIADIRMPGINGVKTIQTINKLKEKNKRKKEPVIFITGYADEKNEKEAKALGPIAYIYKPFDISELVGKINKILK